MLSPENFTNLVNDQSHHIIDVIDEAIRAKASELNKQVVRGQGSAVVVPLDPNWSSLAIDSALNLYSDAGWRVDVGGNTQRGEVASIYLRKPLARWRTQQQLDQIAKD